MKLSNIFLSTLAVLLCCTACSKDEESFKGKDADASLSIAVKAAGSAVTKGFHPNDENELAGEAKVNNLSVLVFDESGAQLIGYGWQATNSEGEASILNVPAMTMRAQIVIVSNTPENSLAGVTSYSDFESKLAQLADQSQSNLVMSSPVITTQAPLVKGDNYLGYASMGSENINGISEGDIQAIYIVAFIVVVIISSVQTVPVNYGGEYFCFRLIRVRFKQSCSDLYFCRGFRAIVFHHVVHIRCVVYRRTVGDIAVQCCRIAVAEVSGCHHHSPIITAEKT